MFRKTGILAAAIVGMMVLTGCQTAAIDTTTTSAFGAPRAMPGAGDLASAKSHFRQANYGLAEKHFRKAVELDAANAEGWLGLAASYDQLGRFDFADRAYAQALKLAGRRPKIVNNMGYSHLLRGDKAQARALLMEARAGMADKRLVDANLKLLGEG
ncbi:hypothetical protein [Mesorhizobium sp. CAU 1741]|uniref:tetratricopeptide repeat protein n=1 Tax=Mesorhizobium sp. CAU 1741 TaxID=3140366 RepID=UPI00325AC488